MNTLAVAACNPARRCLGGGTVPPCTSLCAAGYSGDFCAVCAPGYYELAGDCVECESGAEAFPFAVVFTYFALMALLAVLSLFASSHTIHLIGFFLLMLQVAVPRVTPHALLSS